MPQWLQLAWQDEQKISTVELTFAGHLLREYHAYAPFYRDPQCVRDYDIEIETDGAWCRVLEIVATINATVGTYFPPRLRLGDFAF
jgi:hypothetical protein